MPACHSSQDWVYLSWVYLSLLFFSQLFVRPLQTTILPFCLSFSWGCLITACYTMSRTSVHSSSGTLPIRICLALPLYNHKGFDLGQNKESITQHFFFHKMGFEYSIWKDSSPINKGPSVYIIFSFEAVFFISFLSSDCPHPQNHFLPKQHLLSLRRK